MKQSQPEIFRYSSIMFTVWPKAVGTVKDRSDFLSACIQIFNKDLIQSANFEVDDATVRLDLNTTIAAYDIRHIETHSKYAFGYMKAINDSLEFTFIFRKEQK